MTTFRSEDMLVGLIAFAAVPWIMWILVRGRRDQRLPIGRGHVRQDERPGAYRVLLIFYVVAAALMLFISLDLLLGFGQR
jgi:ABC-type cobalamin transport system permease subunit